MKKILSIFLVALFCISASFTMATVISAEDSDDHLVLHYDFEGNTVEEKLKDKAPLGADRVADDLTLKNGTQDVDGNYQGIDFSNGYVTQKDSDLAKGSRAYLVQSTAASADMKSALEGNMTFVARFRMNSEIMSSDIESDGYVYIFDARVFGTSRAFKVLFNLSNKDLQVGFAGSSNPNSEVTLGISLKDYDFTNSPWINLVCTIGKNSGGGWDLKTYYTFGDPDGNSSWNNKNSSNQFVGQDRAPLTTNAARIFTAGSKTGLCVDDIKLYNTVLTSDEINTVTKISPVKVAGFQTTEPADGKFNIRFVSTVNGLDYRGVGMEVDVACAVDGYKRSFESTDTSTVYEKLLGRTSDGSELRAISASELDAKYMFCLTILGVPAGKEVSFDIRPFVILADGTKEYGDAYIVTFNADGTFKTVKK